ncbi:MAG: hypothetical protein RLZ45_3056, partial [Verrucomicrobiota bacterium]
MRLAFAVVIVLLSLTLLSRVDAADTAPRFESEIRAFMEADRKTPRQPGGILFVGSSIFREWTDVAIARAPRPEDAAADEED